ncbi:MAG: hypothetical protein C4560_13840 [Nitrospiraceae bacterium]|nr:MAG: hypothetical protein C4560_13840 [Nitrospiraceae bacterium]
MFFEKNISALRTVNPELAEAIINHNKEVSAEVVRTKTGMPSVKVGNISLHSLYDPIREARDWVRHHEKEIEGAESICVLGFGLGYHVLELFKNTEAKIIVFEPGLDILKTALGLFCLTSILSEIKIVTDGRVPSFNNTAILEHKPSVNLSRGYFEHLLARLRARERIHQGLKILVVGPLYGGSLPIARYCSSALKKLGHEVEFFDSSRFSDSMSFAKEITKDKAWYNRLIDMLTTFLSEAVLAKCETFKPDLVFALAQAPLTSECLGRLRAHKVPTAFWFVEDFRLMNYWRKLSVAYDYFFTIQQGDFFEELKNEGTGNYCYLPTAACPDEHKEMELTDNEKDYYGSDISFAGAGYYNRRHFFRGLLDLDFKIWGDGWPRDPAYAKYIQRSGGRIETEEMVKVFNASEININLHSSTYHKGVNPFGDFVNPRTFEIAACGAFQLVDRRSGLEGLFDAGEEIIVFDDLDDLRHKISYYIEHPEERKRTAEKARQRVRKEHTYEHRMRRMLEFIADCGYEPPVRNAEGERIQDLIGEAGDDSELVEYLSGFDGRERVTLPDIIRKIENGEGAISRTETIFLMMNELIKK